MLGFSLNFRRWKKRIRITSSAEGLWQGESGPIGKELLARHMKDRWLPVYYVAGPPDMVKGVHQMLSSLALESMATISGRKSLRATERTRREVRDICVVGAGIAGITTGVDAREGRKIGSGSGCRAGQRRGGVAEYRTPCHQALDKQNERLIFDSWQSQIVTTAASRSRARRQYVWFVYRCRMCHACLISFSNWKLTTFASITGSLGTKAKRCVKKRKR